MLSLSHLWLWLHLTGVVLWAGGFLYLALVFIPAMNTGKDTPERTALIQQAAARFRTISWIAVTLIVITGVMNLVVRMQIGGMQTRELMALYMRVLTIKLVLVIGLIVHLAIKALEPRVVGGGRVGLKSGITAILTSAMFLVAILMGLILRTL